MGEAELRTPSVMFGWTCYCPEPGAPRLVVRSGGVLRVQGLPDAFEPIKSAYSGQCGNQPDVSNPAHVRQPAGPATCRRGIGASMCQSRVWRLGGAGLSTCADRGPIGLPIRGFFGGKERSGFQFATSARTRAPSRCPIPPRQSGRALTEPRKHVLAFPALLPLRTYRSAR